MQEEVEFGRVWAVVLLAAFAAPPVVLALGETVGGFGGTVSMVAVLVPLVAVTVVLGRLALRVGSTADDPELVDETVARATGVSSEDYEAMFD